MCLGILYQADDTRQRCVFILARDQHFQRSMPIDAPAIDIVADALFPWERFPGDGRLVHQA